jgi:hypothetical protein
MWHARGRREVRAGFWWGNLKKRGPVEGLGVDGRIILKWISGMIVGRGLDSSGSGQGQIVGYCEYLNKRLAYKKSDDFS